MDKNFKYIALISVIIGLLTLGGLSAFHYHMYRCVNRYAEQGYQLLDNLKSSSSVSQNKIRYIQHKHSEEYYNFLKSYYETQNNWLNYWLATMGILLTIMGLIIPYIFARRWQDEKDEMNNIKEKFSKEISLAEEKLNRLDVNFAKIEFDKLIADKTVELNEMVTSAIDDLWQNIDDKKENLITSIKSTIIEDLLKNGPDTDYFLDKISSSLSDYINDVIETKLQGDSDDRY